MAGAAHERRCRMSDPKTREIHVLCGAPSTPSRPRFESEAAQLGRAVRWLDPHAVETTPEGLRYEGEPLALPEVALARSGGYTTDRALDALRAYESFGVRVVDSVESIERCRDKLLATSLLAAAGLPVPATAAVGPAGGIMTAADAIELLGPPPLVVKPSRGMKGAGVTLAVQVEDLAAALPGEGPLVVQEYVPHESDVRVIVIGGEAIGAIRRTPQADFRCNLHVGGRARSEQLGEEAAALAVAAAAALGAEIAGVDLLPKDGGHVVLEVNTSPGFDGFERATGANVAAAILRHALALA